MVAASPARAEAVTVVTAVDSAATVTPDANGLVTVPYCPATNPCAFAEPPTAVTVTGSSATAANLVVHSVTTTGFTLRAYDRTGRPLTTRIKIYYHAGWYNFDQADDNRTERVTTDANGYATVPIANVKFGVVPDVVIASGVGGAAASASIPASIVVPSRTDTSFRIRAYTPTGAPIANGAIDVAYYAAWTGYLEPAVGVVGRNATVTVTTDGAGYAKVAFDGAFAGAPAIQAVGVAGAKVPASVLVDQASPTGFRVRVLGPAGSAVVNTSVTLSYQAVHGTRR